MKKTLFVLAALIVVASMLLTGCGKKATEVPVTEAPKTEAPATEAPATEAPAEVVQIRWFVGLGTGTDPAQVEVQQAVVDAFNASHPNIELVLEIVPYDAARDTLATQIASGAGPDIIGPVGWSGSNAFYGQWLDITPYMGDFDLSIFDPALVTMYQTEEGQVGLPFAVYPAALWYNPALFDDAGLNYPPANWGDKYEMPDGTMVDWSWDTAAEVAKLMTIDANGKNSTEEGFDKTNIVQAGYHPAWSGHPSYLGTYWGAAKVYEGSAGSYTAKFPDNWVAAWEWYYNGIWGDQPFIPNAALAGAAEFGTGNTFNSGHLAMTTTNLWYACCLGDFATAGNEFQFAAIPSYNGKISGRVDADTFRIWKGTPHPAEAFEVLAYLINETGSVPLNIGQNGVAAAYGAFPAITSLQGAWLEAKKTQYPFVNTWDTIVAGNAYPDSPSAEGYMPNYNEAWSRIQTFGDLMGNDGTLDLAAEIAKLEADLAVIFNK